MKHDKMIQMSQERSRKKVELAIQEIQNMLKEGDRITVTKLCRRTGISNSFFYRNEKVKEAVHNAIDSQEQSYKMDIDDVTHIDWYKEKLLEMRVENIKLKSENQRLKSEIATLMETEGKR